MYGLWLFKELKTEYGNCKVELYRKGYTASAVEIGGFVGNSLNLALENLDTITAPIGKSVCSFAIYDTEQVEYDDLFTPDATAYKVVVSTRVGSGAYVTRWSGYVTPDFFAENLSFRTPISISARDNIGYLNDVDFDLDTATITVRELIQAAFNRIAEDYPMSLSFVTQKQTAEGILAIDATISTYLLREMSWYEALETILHDLGLQMRWVDNNTIAVLDLSQIPEYFPTQGFNFVEASGYREIVPAWRELSQEHNYGVLENFYKGQIDGENKIEYAANSAINSNILLYQPKEITQWSRKGEVYFLNLYNSYNINIDDDKQDSIYITGLATNTDTQNVLATKMVYTQDVTEVDKQIKITFNLNDTLRTPLVSQYSRGERNILYLPYSQSSGNQMLKIPHPYQLKYRFNIFLRGNDGTTYVMREDWVEESALSEQPFIEFLTDKLQTVDTGVTDGQGNHRFAYIGYNNSKEYSITIGSIPKAGTLEFVVYPWTFEQDDYPSTRDAATYQRGAKISDIVFSVQVGNTGIVSAVSVGENHNVKVDESYKFGEVPQRDGDVITYAGGLFDSDSIMALQGFKRNSGGLEYHLLELVGRELIHYNRKNYNRLSGTIKNLNKEPLMFNRLFLREDKKYAPYNYSLNVISNEMSITSMQEVEPYETATLSEIRSEVSTGGATVGGGGNNTVLQYSQDAGNTKRIYELQSATEAEREDSYVMVDKEGFPEARRVHISELGGFDVSELEQYLENSGYATLKRIWEVDTLNGIVRTTYNVISTQEVISGRRASGSSSDVTGGGGISQITAQMIADALGYMPYSAANPAGYITNSALKGYAKETDIPSLSGYATETWVKQQGYLTQHQDLSAYAKKTDIPSLNGYATQSWVEGKKYLTGITSAMVTTALGYTPYNSANFTKATIKSTLGIADWALAASKPSYSWSEITGKPSFATVATSGKYSDLSGTPSSLPASDVYAWAKAATKPSYTASEVGALSTGGGTISGSRSTILTVNRTGGIPYVCFNKDGSLLGFLGIRTEGYPVFVDSGGVSFQMLHEGNYSSYALPLSGGTIKSTSVVPLTVNSTYSGESLILIQNNGNSKVAVGWMSDSRYGTYIYSYAANKYLGIKDDGTPHFQGQTLIHSGNIGLYNAGSATKLQTARTIWGQSFDGTGNVSGILRLYDSNGYHANILGNTTGITLDTWRDDVGYFPIKLAPNGGNVLIGTTTDSGYKLDVNGTSVVRGKAAFRHTILADRYNGQGNTAGAAFIVNKGGDYFGVGASSGNVSNISFGWVSDLEGTWKKELVTIKASNNIILNQGVYISATDSANTARGILELTTSQNRFIIGYGVANAGYDTSLQGNNIEFTYGSSHAVGMKLTSGGNVLIGTTTDSGDKLRINGAVRAAGHIRLDRYHGASEYLQLEAEDVNINYRAYDTDGWCSHNFYSNDNLLVRIDGYAGKLDINGSLVATGEVISSRRASSSDRRLKNNITYLDTADCLAMVRQIRPAEWDWKDNGKHSMGFIAQDVEHLMPYAVTSIKDDILGQKLNLQYDQFIALAIGGVQAVDNEVVRLKARVEYLENKIKEYEYGNYRN